VRETRSFGSREATLEMAYVSETLHSGISGIKGLQLLDSIFACGSSSRPETLSFIDLSVAFSLRNCSGSGSLALWQCWMARAPEPSYEKQRNGYLPWKDIERNVRTIFVTVVYIKTSIACWLLSKQVVKIRSISPIPSITIQPTLTTYYLQCNTTFTPHRQPAMSTENSASSATQPGTFVTVSDPGGEGVGGAGNNRAKDLQDPSTG